MTSPKIYILPVDPYLQPTSQPFKYPAHNVDWGVEQDFLAWTKNNTEYISSNPHHADYHYLPVFWTRYHLNNDYGTKGQNKLKELVERAVLDDSKTFTICQYDDGPNIDLGRTIQFLASRKSAFGIDIPLLCSTHRIPWIRPRKKLLASFAGHLDRHPLRRDMANALRDCPDVHVSDGVKGSRYFVDLTLSSRVCLSPRGYGGSSFRTFEAMSLGVVPLVIGDIDTRPFRRFLNWDTCSLFTKDPSQTYNLLSSRDTATLDRMGRTAKKVWREHLRFGQWCRLAVQELKTI